MISIREKLTEILEFVDGCDSQLECIESLVTEIDGIQKEDVADLVKNIHEHPNYTYAQFIDIFLNEKEKVLEAVEEVISER